MFDTEIDHTPADPYQSSTLVVDETNADLFRGGFLGLGGFYLRPFKIAAGGKKPGHQHHINHLGLLLSGQARVNWRAPDGTCGTVEFRAGWASMHIRADYWHEIEAITDVEWACIFSKAEADRVYGDATKVDWIMEAAHG
jgi:hypothetical protein